MTRAEGGDLATLRADLERLALTPLGEADEVAAGLSLARKLGPHAVVVDVRLLRPEAAFELEALRAERVAPVLLYGAPACGDLARLAVEAGAAAHLPANQPLELLRPAVAIGMANWRERRKLERDFARTRERLAKQHVVTRAKGVLMAANPGWNETKAYEHLRTLSMKVRKSIPEVAEAILIARSAITDDAP